MSSNFKNRYENELFHHDHHNTPSDPIKTHIIRTTLVRLVDYKLSDVRIDGPCRRRNLISPLIALTTTLTNLFDTGCHRHRRRHRSTPLNSTARADRSDVDVRQDTIFIRFRPFYFIEQPNRPPLRGRDRRGYIFTRSKYDLHNIYSDFIGIVFPDHYKTLEYGYGV